MTIMVFHYHQKMDGTNSNRDDNDSSDGDATHTTGDDNGEIKATGDEGEVVIMVVVAVRC